jgi:hypothetical protein
MAVFGVVFSNDKDQDIWATALQLDEFHAVSVVCEPVLEARCAQNEERIEIERRDPDLGLILLRRPCPGARTIQFLSERPTVAERGQFVFSRDPQRQGVGRSKAVVAGVRGNYLVVDTHCSYMTAGGAPLVIGDRVAGLAVAKDFLITDISYFHDADCVTRFLGAGAPRGQARGQEQENETAETYANL